MESLAFLIALAVLAYAIWASMVVLQKAGRSRWWALLVFFPFLYLVGIWVLAFTEWPAQPQGAGSRSRLAPPAS